MSALTPYAQELLDGFREAVAQSGAPITFAGSVQCCNVLLVYPEASNDTQNAGTQARAKVGVEMERTAFLAAGVNEFSRFTVAGDPQLLHVTGIEADPGCPLVFFSGEEVQ